MSSDARRTWYRSLWRLVAVAFEEASSAGHHWVGPEHLLLGILREESAATRVLGGFGVRYDVVRAEVAREVAEPHPQPEKTDDSATCFNPAAYGVEGMAKGLAAGLGADAVGLEHVLLALIWVIAELAAQGVRVPLREPPPRDPRTWGEPVFVPAAELGQIMREIERLSPGIQISFNYESDYRGWLSTLEGVDLEHYVALARKQLNEGRCRSTAG